MYGLHVMGYIGIALIISALSSPTIFGEDVSSNFISKSSEDIAHAVFQTSGKSEANYIFSPFGYSVILGILSEGARGATREELTNVLHSPENEGTIRRSFKTTLQRLHERSAADMPEFRTYFYVYKNFTVDDHYKATLLENYYTDVRNVDRNNDSGQEANSTLANSDDIPVIEESENGATTFTSVDSFESSVDPTTTPRAIVRQEEQSSPANSSANNKITRKSAQNVARFLPAKSFVKRAKKTGRHYVDRTRLRRIAKRFLGIDLSSDGGYRSEISARIDGQRYTNSLSRILVFNGLYFKGYWKVPFQRAKTEETFYKNGTEKISSKMMFATGEFDVAQIPELNSALICIPYKSERYSFMILLPNRREGIQDLVAGLEKFDLSEARSKQERRHIHITMPVFRFDTTSYLKESLKTIGVRRIFTREADFTGLSRDSGLFVDDIIQLVTIQVDTEAATPNFMTASSVETRTVTEKFHVDHPFVFLIVDRKEDLIIAAGQVYEPIADDN